MDEELEDILASLQKCDNGHRYFADSPEYPCPLCINMVLLGCISDIRTLVTGCVPKSVSGRYKETCKAVLARTMDIEHSKPSWYRHDWEKAIYEKHEQRSTNQSKTSVAPERKDNGKAF